MEKINVAIAQISPVWLHKKATLEKVAQYIEQAADNGAHLVAFGEALAPGYPYWLELTGGAAFNNEKQKEMFAWYNREAIAVGDGELTDIQKMCRSKKIACYLGLIEKTLERGQSLFCSMVYIDQRGEIRSVHRKLMPTYEERLVWSPGDGNGLRTHQLNGFTVGGLNCWENWIPMARQALYAQGENLHVAIWPGSIRNTEDITRFIAKESRSFVMSVSGLYRVEDIPDDVPVRDEIIATGTSVITDGGSCIAAPNGDWVIEPIVDKECISIATLELDKVRQERQNFDPAGHYSRPDVLKLKVNRKRQSTAKIKN
ncbi:MAG: carbon-nitrogen hydrolase family protein [Gammaproteobacteria bacterium]|nr:carbon-nitrogen hydrolase family protein [Gammaproteobacteria bacterium]